MSTSPVEAEKRLELLLEVKDFPPPSGFAAQAKIADPAVYTHAAADPPGWWAAPARPGVLRRGRDRLGCACRPALPAVVGQGILGHLVSLTQSPRP